MKKDTILKVSAIVGAILAFFGMSLIGMPILPFTIIMVLGIGYIIIYVIRLYLIGKTCQIEKVFYKKYYKKYRRFLKEIKQAKDADEYCEKIAQLANYIINNKKQKSKINKYYKREYNKAKQKIKVAAGVILCICIFNFNYVTGFAKGIFVIIESIQTLDLKSTQEIAPTPNPTSIPTSTPTPIQAPTPPSETEIAIPIPTPNIENNSSVDDENQTDWIKFKLKYPNGYPGITNSEFDGLYESIFYVNMGALDETIERQINTWMNSYTINASLDNVINSYGKSASYYSDIEEGFSNEGGKLLSSDLLDEIIGGREDFMDSYQNGTLAWLLANHYQTYALNYLNQTKNEKSTLYFYMKSISNAQKSLEFEMDNKSKKERIEYIQSRYKDIAECEILDNEVRVRAYEILMAINDALVELK